MVRSPRFATLLIYDSHRQQRKQQADGRAEQHQLKK